MDWIVLATEDELSEQVGLSLAAEAQLEVAQCLRKEGFGYLRTRMPNFCQMARWHPVFVITDLDQAPCPSYLIDAWRGRRRLPANLVFRVAVHEIESWLLADHQAIRAMLGARAAVLPDYPDTLPHPKEVLLGLARRAPRDIREDLVAQRGAVAGQGLGYNARLCRAED